MGQPATDSPGRIIAVFLLDFVIGIGLFLMACFLGDWLHDALVPDVDVLYVPCFLIALIPFLLYLNWRQKIFHDWRDWCEFLLCAGVISAFTSILNELPQLPVVTEALLIASAATLGLFMLDRLFRRNFRRDQKDDVES